jgi:SAM-dependent methyltransferase
MPPRSVARQLSHPSGFFGRLIRFLMNRGNAKMNAFALRQLDLTPADRVLEIGFGGGATLPALLKDAAFVAGVDRSHDAVASALARHAKEVVERRATFVEGVVEAIPFPAASFDKVFTVNTVYFWRSLAAGFAEIHRVLAPQGRIVVGFVPKQRMDRMNFPADIFTSRATEDVIAALIANGFEQARAARPESATPWNVVVATRDARV